MAAPAVAGLDDERGACKGHEDQGEAKCLGLDDCPHDQSHRIPAPTVRTREARSVMRTQVKTRQVRFHDRSPSYEELFTGLVGNRAVSGEIPGFASPPRDGFALDDRSSAGQSPVSRYCRPPIGGPNAPAVLGTLGFGAVVTAQRGALSRRPPACYAGAMVDGALPARIAATMTTTMPIPITTSPMLKTLANGSQRGQGEDVGQRPQRPGRR